MLLTVLCRSFKTYLAKLGEEKKTFPCSSWLRVCLTVLENGSPDKVKQVSVDIHVSMLDFLQDWFFNKVWDSEISYISSLAIKQK